MSLDKSLHVWLWTLLATLLNGSVHTSHMWSNMSSDMHWRMCTMSPRMCLCFSMEPFTLRHIKRTCKHIYVDDAGDMQTLSQHMCLSAFTLENMCAADKSLDASSDLRPSVKALWRVACTIAEIIATAVQNSTFLHIPLVFLSRNRNHMILQSRLITACK